MTIDNRDMSGIGGIGWMILLMIRDTRMLRLVCNRRWIDGALGVWESAKGKRSYKPVYTWVPLILLTTLFVIGIIPGCTLLWYDDWINAGVEAKIENEMFDAVDQAILESSTLDSDELELIQNASKLFD